MTRALVNSQPAPLATLTADVERAQAAAAEARAPNTLEAYGRAWRSFRAWCKEVEPENPSALDLPSTPATVAVYLAHVAEHRNYKPATLDVHLAAIAYYHRQHGLVFDRKAVAVADVRAGLRRQKGVKQKRARALMPEDLATMCSGLGDRMIEIRDRAILLVAFAGAFRSSELLGALSGLRVADCKRTKAGYELTVRRSKTDQEGEGLVKHVALGHQETCPVDALDAWLEARAGAADDPVFIGFHGWSPTPSGIALTRGDLREIIRRTAERAGLDVNGLSGHSPRAGLVTAAVEAGVAERDIMAVTGHKDRNTLEGYVRRAQAKVRPAAKGLV